MEQLENIELEYQFNEELERCWSGERDTVVERSRSTLLLGVLWRCKWVRKRINQSCEFTIINQELTKIHNSC